MISVLTEKFYFQEYLNLFLITTTFFLKYLIFLSTVPIGCSRLTVSLLAISLALTAMLILANENVFWSSSSLSQDKPRMGLWINQSMLGLKLAVPFILVGCCINFLGTLLEGLVGGGFMGLISPWSKTNSSSLRTLLESWAIGVVLLPKQFELLVRGLFEGVTIAGIQGSNTYLSISGESLFNFAQGVLVKFWELVSGFSSLLLIYLFLDMAAMIISKVLNRGMFQGELGQLKGVVTLLILTELSKDPHFGAFF